MYSLPRLESRAPFKGYEGNLLRTRSRSVHAPDRLWDPLQNQPRKPRCSNLLRNLLRNPLTCSRNLLRNPEPAPEPAPEPSLKPTPESVPLLGRRKGDSAVGVGNTPQTPAEGLGRSPSHVVTRNAEGSAGRPNPTPTPRGPRGLPAAPCTSLP